MGLALLALNASLGSGAAAEGGLRWRQLAPLPDALGVAGAYAGVSRGALLVAGGANFPGRMPWEGGIKVWHDRVFVLEKPGGAWKEGARLPFPCGYGISVTTPGGVLCAGGSNSRGHLTNVFLLQWTGKTTRIEHWPPLPKPVANGCGALVGGSVYLAGGTVTPDAVETSHLFLRLDLRQQSRGWHVLPAWPGRPRMLATAAAMDGEFYVIGGVDLHCDAQGAAVRTYLRDGFRFDPGQGWRPIASLPDPLAAAPSPAPALGPASFLLVGGDDGSQIGFAPKSLHPGFDSRVLRYDVRADTWRIYGHTPAPRVTLPAVRWRNLFVFLSGEHKPGVRSPEVWAAHHKRL